MTERSRKEEGATTVVYTSEDNALMAVIVHEDRLREVIENAWVEQDKRCREAEDGGRD